MRQALLLLLATLPYSHTTMAQEGTLFSIKNQNPFIQIFGLPATQPATLLATDGSAIDVALDMANNSIINKGAGAELITLDGESVRISITLRQAIGDRAEMGVELPLVGHHNGILDNFIEGWHKTWGLSNTERNQSPSNVLNYTYVNNGVTVLSLQRPNNGLGDIRIFGAKQLHTDHKDALSLHFSLKTTHRGC